MTLGEAAKLPNAPDRTTLWRWCVEGLPTKSGRRIYLESVRLGGRLFTTKDAIDAFSAALAQADREYSESRRNGKAHFDTPKLTASDRAHERAERDAERRLKVRGLL